MLCLILGNTYYLPKVKIDTTRDAVTLPGGSPIDGAVRAIDFSYSAKGELDTVTSLNAASGIVNRVWFKYTPFGQLSEDRQAHNSLPAPSAPVVRYTYRTHTVPGSNDVRPLSVTYPGGRRIQFQYGLVGSDNELLGRIGSLRAVGEPADFADYQYVGIDRFVKVSYVQPAVNLSYINPDGLNAGDAGDPYTGWDRFGRTQDMRWTKGTAILDRILYGYDRGSRRKWRDNARAPVGEDEFYDYDGLSQLLRRDRGELNLNRTAIGGVPKRQEDFTYDRIGNWDRYRFSKDGSVQLDQTRVHNRSNVLTQIDGSSALLEHDPAGNMTKVPPQEDAEWSKAYVLKWDAWNRLVKVSTPTGTVVAEYAYDGITRRVLNRAGGISSHYYYNSQWRPVEEREEAVSEVSATYDWGIRYRDDLVRRTKLLAPPNPGSSSSSGEVSSGGSGSGPLGNWNHVYVRFRTWEKRGVRLLSRQVGSMPWAESVPNVGCISAMDAHRILQEAHATLRTELGPIIGGHIQHRHASGVISNRVWTKPNQVGSVGNSPSVGKLDGFGFEAGGVRRTGLEQQENIHLRQLLSGLCQETKGLSGMRKRHHVVLHHNNSIFLVRVAIEDLDV